MGIIRIEVSEQEFNERFYYADDEGNYYPMKLDRGNACVHIQDEALKWCKGQGIDVGAGYWPLPTAIPIQNEKEQNAYRLNKFEDGSLDYVFSSHCLEHLERWQDALKLWIKKLKPGGILFLYSPHPDMTLWRPGGLWVKDSHKWSPSWDVLSSFCSRNGIKILNDENGPDKWYSFHLIGKKVMVDGKNISARE